VNVNDYHQQRRKHVKEQDNSDCRPRCYKVKESKTVEEVKTEIRDVEKKYKTPEMIPHRRQKLDRLKKEPVVEERLRRKHSITAKMLPTSHYQSS
jgi:hypothetical protein